MFGITFSRNAMCLWVITTYINVMVIDFSLVNMPARVEAIPSISAGRRRRRSTFRMRICGQGERAIWSESKKKVLGCAPCDKGEYRSDETHNNELCNVCEAGRISSSDKSYCIGDICKPGTYGTVGETMCKSCESGKYSQLHGMFRCVACESGRYNTGISNTDCLGSMCPEGKWGAVGIQTASSEHRVCFDCSPGLWNNETGKKNCEQCPTGKYSPDSGARYCITHDTCPRTMRYSNDPPITSNIIKCTKCIYASDLTFSAFIISASVSLFIVLIVLLDIKKNWWLTFFIIWPCIWTFAFVFCIVTPSEVSSSISIIVNVGLLTVCCKVFMYTVLDIYRKISCNRILAAHDNKLQNTAHVDVETKKNNLDVVYSTTNAVI